MPLSNEEKKIIETRALTAARSAGVPIPAGEISGEEPDFRFHTETGILGVEVSELMRPASSNAGIAPASEETYHQEVVRMAQQYYRAAGAGPAKVVMYFADARGKRRDKGQMARTLGVFCALALAGCGGGSAPATNNPQTPAARPCSAPAYDSTLPFPLRVKRAFIVVLENHSFESVLGSPNMVYLNRLARTYAYAAGYFANTHPSLPNYFMLTAGLAITDSDTGPAIVSDDNIVRRLIMAGKTWKEYSQGLPSTGYDGGDVGAYIQHHNPLSYFSDVRNDSSQKVNLVPFSQISTDLANQSLPEYAFIVPDNTHNAHSCPSSEPACTDGQKLATADNWLKLNIGPLLDAPDFNQTGGSVLIVVFDESAGADTQKGGGHVLWVVVGPDVKKGYVATTCYQHESTLRFMASLLGLPNAPGGAATSPDMREFLLGN